jgi:hypothetical protein
MAWVLLLGSDFLMFLFPILSTLAIFKSTEGEMGGKQNSHTIIKHPHRMIKRLLR